MDTTKLTAFAQAVGEDNKKGKRRAENESQHV